MAEFRVEWTVAARADFLEIIRFIATDSPLNAMAVLERIERAALTMRRLPGRGRRVPELGRSRELEIREVIVKPWRMMYRVDGHAVRIIAVVDSRRDLGDWLRVRLAYLAAMRT